MPALNTYQKPEEAYLDAAYLCSMGLDAAVEQNPACSGMMLGVIESSYHLHLPDDEIDRGKELLSQRNPQPVLSEPLHPSETGPAPLEAFFRFILIFDSACFIIFSISAEWLDPKPSVEVLDFLQGLSLSYELWLFSFYSCWPIVVLGLVANALCFLYRPIGRTLFTLVIVWGVLTTLGPPPLVLNPYHGFFGSIQNILSSIALALMYWSPIRIHFSRTAAQSD